VIRLQQKELAMAYGKKWEAKLVLNHAKVVLHLQRASVRVNAWLRRRSNGEWSL